MSCKENQSEENQTRRKVIAPGVSQNFQIMEGERYLEYKLPDTIALKDTIKGYIVYKSEYDTLIDTSERSHFVNLYFTDTDTISKDFKSFETKDMYTFARIHDSLFIIYDITFDKRGNHLLEGYIKEYLYEDINKDSMHFRTIENHLLYKVYVK